MATKVGYLGERRAPRWRRPPELPGLVLPTVGMGPDVPTQVTLCTWPSVEQ